MQPMNRLPTEAEIRCRAQEIYQIRGQRPGRELDDWLQAEYELAQLPVAELAKAKAEIAVLEGLLLICARCKKIQDGQGTWQQMESYISERSPVRFSHALCPECAQKTLEEAGIRSTI